MLTGPVFGKAPEDVRGAIWREVDEARRQLTPEAIRRVRSRLQTDQSHIQTDPTTINSTYAPGGALWEEWRFTIQGIWLFAGDPFFQRVIDQAAKSHLAADVGRKAIADWPTALQFLFAKVKESATRTTATIARTLRGALDDLNGTQSDSDRIELVFRNLDGTFAKATGTAAVLDASISMQQQAAKVVAVNLEKVWLTVRDDRVRDTHAAADGQVRPLDEPYLVGGFELDYPRDPSGPLHEIINCRCFETYEPAAMP